MNFVRTALIWLSALVAALCLWASPALTRTIVNTAQASWLRGEASFLVRSNTVVIETVPEPARVEILVAAQDGRAISFIPPSCGNGSESGTEAKGEPVTAKLSPATEIHGGDLLYFRIVAPAANVNPAAVDWLRVKVNSPSGDREEVLTYETSNNSGEFVGFIQTASLRTAPVGGDCVLSAEPRQQVMLQAFAPTSAQIIGASQVGVLADPFGVVVDSETGAPVDGARITLLDAVTGQPAPVLADDGTTPWPSTVVSGQPVTDGAGRTYQFQAGEYRFPLIGPGRYRLEVEPPAKFSAPSGASAAQLGTLRRPDGGPLNILPASGGAEFSISGLAPLRVDIPLDPQVTPLGILKQASRQDAMPGDAVIYSISVRNNDPSYTMRGVTVADAAGTALRLSPGTVRIDGRPAGEDLTTNADGAGFSVDIGSLTPGSSRTITYAMSVRADASAGTVINEAQARDDRGRSSKAAVPLRVMQEELASRMTLIGRVAAGGCSASGLPVPGVRIMIEDGSFSVTDSDGRYHFSGLMPGNHVVRAIPATLPQGSKLINCTRSTRSAGNAQTRFVTGRGALAVADFAVVLPKDLLPTPISPLAARDVDPAEERKAAGADTDWLTMGNGPAEFLFPAIDYNPRVPATRVVIRHRADQTVRLKANGRPVDNVAFDGTNQAPGGRFSVSIWRGVPLGTGMTRLEAEVLNGQGAVVTTLNREVYFSQGPARIELVENKSRLIADGHSRPVLALRILDRKGRPVRAGSTGEFRLSAPYESAEASDAAQQNSIMRQSRAMPHWFVRGDDGMAYVELAPSMISGKLSAHFTIVDGKTQRETDIETWMVPAPQAWTIVGLAEGGLAGGSITHPAQSGRMALYAKGSLASGVLLTAAYDTDRQREDHSLTGSTDPRATYNVFADLSDRRFDAASRDKAYARVEGKGFYAIYGDVESGFDQTELARYLRAATGVKAEVNRGDLHWQGFAARMDSLHRQDEFQGAGISGPYRLSSRAMVVASETVTIEIRDRFRPEIVLSSRILTRFLDYDLDLIAGTITFREPVQSRDFELNPRFVVVDYEVAAGAATGELNGGMRGSLDLAEGRVQIGASVLSDTAGPGRDRGNLVAIDLQADLGSETRLRAELGKSFSNDERGSAWLVEGEHHDGKVDLLAYARSATRQFGLPQQSGIETDWRKFGVDLGYHLTDRFSIDLSSWHADSLADQARRTALQLGGHWAGESTDARLGMAFMRDRLADGRTVQSTVLEGGATRRLLGNRLELSASSSIALGNAGAIDLPARHRLGARYALTSDVRVIGSYELAQGDGVEARTAQAGVEFTPWQGGSLRGTLGQQLGAELPSRSYAAFGVTQSVPFGANLMITATLDSNRTLSLDRDRVLDPAHPVASGGFLDGSGAVAEDFTAATLGATWRKGLWSATMRGEWRGGQLEDRTGLTLGAIRQLGEGSMAGAAFTWTGARTPAGAISHVIDSALSLAHRPSASDIAFLAKLEYRSDHAQNTAARGSAGTSVTTGESRSERLIASLSGTWTPQSKVTDGVVKRHEVGLFAAVRQNLDRFGDYDLRGTSVIGGLDLRFGLNDRLDLGLGGTVRANLTNRTAVYAIGPQIGLTPAKDLWLVFGYNLSGFHDPDFAAARSTTKGPFVTLRFKFDETILDKVGLRSSM